MDALERLLHGPAAPPPPGVVPDLAGSHNPLLPWVYVVSIVFGLSTTFAMFTRIYTKRVLIGEMGREDYFSIVAYCLFIVFLASTSMIVHYGGGRHQWNVPLFRLRDQLKWLHVSTMLYDLTIISVQASVLYQYIAVFVPANKKGPMFWVCQSLIGATAIFYTICFFLEVFNCKPISKIWTPWMKTGKCLNRTVISIAAASFNSALELFIWILPQRAIWQLNLPVRQKIGVSAVFAVGLLACVSTMIRLYFAVHLLHSTDYTYDLIRFGLFTIVEICCSIICSCAPTFPRWFQSVSPYFSFIGRIFTPNGLQGEHTSRYPDADPDRTTPDEIGHYGDIKAVELPAELPADPIHGDRDDTRILQTFTIHTDTSDHRGNKGRDAKNRTIWL